MDIRGALLQEHSRRQTIAIVEFVGGDPGRFADLISVFLEGEYRLTQRAAWPVSCCVERWPELAGPYLESLIDQLKRNDVHDAIKRNVARLLQFVEIPEGLLGKVYSHCLDLIDDLSEPVAVRAFALTVAGKIAQREPALANELRLLVSKHLPHSSVAFHRRARPFL